MDVVLAKNRKVLKSNSERGKTFQLCSMCLIPMLLLFVFNYIPLFGLVIAFKDYRFDKGIFGSDWCGFTNFRFLFESGDFVRILRNTIGLNFLFIAANLVAQVAVAILLYEVKSRRKTKVYQTSMILPHFISWVIVGYMAYTVLNPQYGSLNAEIRKFGGTGVEWYSSPKYWPFILLISNVWKGVGMGSVTYYASLMGIDNSYFEAAAIDGASKWQEIRYVTIPFLVPLMTILTILSIGKILRADFGLFYQVSRDSGALYSVTDVLDTYIYRVMRVQGDMAISSAASFLQSVVGFVLVLTTNAIVNRINPDNALF